MQRRVFDTSEMIIFIINLHLVIYKTAHDVQWLVFNISTSAIASAIIRS